MNKKILFVSLILNTLLLSIIVFLVSVLKLPPQTTSSTKPIITKVQPVENFTQASSTDQLSPVYTNKEFGFTFQYPSTLAEAEINVVKDTSRPDIVYITFADKKYSQNWEQVTQAYTEGGPDTIEVSIFKNTKRLSPKDWIIENANAEHIYTNYDYLSQNLETIEIDGREAVKYSWSGLGGADVVVFTDNNTNRMYMVYARYMSNMSTIRGDLWDVITSFKFIDNTVTK